MDHFPIFLTTDPITSSEIKKNKRAPLYKITINTATKENSKNILARKTWDYVKEIFNPNEAYRKFLYGFFSLYEEAFPKLEIMKSTKQKQKLYNKFLKLRTKENKVIYKAYKNLFWAIRKKIEKNLWLWIIYKL